MGSTTSRSAGRRPPSATFRTSSVTDGVRNVTAGEVRTVPRGFGRTGTVAYDRPRPRPPVVSNAPRERGYRSPAAAEASAGECLVAGPRPESLFEPRACAGLLSLVDSRD